MNFELPTTKQELLSVLKSIDEYYKYRKGEYEEPTVEDLVLEKMSFKPLGVVDLRSKAASYYQEIMDAECNEKLTEYNNELSRINAKKQADGNALDEKRAALEKKYAESEKKLKDNADYRFAGNSTALAKAIAALEEAKNNAIAEAEARYASALYVYETEEQIIISAMDNLGETLQIKYSPKITEMYLKLQDAQNKYQDEVLKYNNKVEEITVKHNNSSSRLKGELKLQFLSLVSTGLTEEQLDQLGYYKDVITAVDAYYFSLTPLAAYNDFTAESQLLYYLGKYYDSMLYKFTLRKNNA